MLLCAITSRVLFPGDEPARRVELVRRARHWAAAGIAYIQVREKDLPLNELQTLAAQISAAVREQNSTTRVLLNGPAEIALAAGADGVHLPADALPAAFEAAHNVYRRAGREAILSAACHTLADIDRARQASLLLFSPVFEKITPDREKITPDLEKITPDREKITPDREKATPDRVTPTQERTALTPDPTLPGVGLAALAEAARAAQPTPVLALGGVTSRNAPSCIEAGAAGIAAIRLFLTEDWHNLL